MFSSNVQARQHGVSASQFRNHTTSSLFSQVVTIAGVAGIEAAKNDAGGSTQITGSVTLAGVQGFSAVTAHHDIA